MGSYARGSILLRTLNNTTVRRSKRTAAELNIAPLIDMVFILLIFFLVNTSFVKETGIDVSRPTASTAVSKAKATILIAGVGPGQINVFSVIYYFPGTIREALKLFPYFEYSNNAFRS